MFLPWKCGARLRVVRYHSDRVNTVSTPMPRLICLLATIALAACAPTHAWVHPSASLGQRNDDFNNCRNEASFHARRATGFERDRLSWEAYRARTPGERAFAQSRLQQLDLSEGMNRNRFFEGCLQSRGYSLQRVAEP